MDKRQFTGKNLEEALAEAAKAFSIDKTLLCYNVVQQSSGSFFSKLFSRSVRIEAWVETAKQDLQAAAREVVRQALSNSKTSVAKPQQHVTLNSSTNKDVKETVRKDKFQRRSDLELTQNPKKIYNQENASQRTLLNMKSEGVEALFEDYKKLFFSSFDVPLSKTETILSESEAVVKVSDEFIESFLSKSDRLSLAFEHVFKRVAQKKLGDISSRINLDAGESSEKREERLIGMARSLADKVRKTGKSVILSSKSSQERRIIHLALDGFTGVATRSVGTGDKRRLVIYSTERKSNKQNNNQSQVKSNNLGEKQVHPQVKPKRKHYPKRNKQNTAPNQNSERMGAITLNDAKELNLKNEKEKFTPSPMKDE